MSALPALRPSDDAPTLEPRAIPVPPDGELPALARPYTVADEQRRQRRPRTGPRVELIRAPHGGVVIW
ncbi:hypothetical protein [Streptomyces malaysiensis]|uniref:hypothetical protein n=1 Tax=Streptomyces malaysiensis TaxID=92644 RepID=UPI00115E6197|nr:hypothetical protein [Streptomyces malaysiensis]